MYAIGALRVGGDGGAMARGGIRVTGAGSYGGAVSPRRRRWRRRSLDEWQTLAKWLLPTQLQVSNGIR